MADPVPDRRIPVLQAFREALAGPCPAEDPWIQQLAEWDLLEEALAELKRLHPRPEPAGSWQPFRARLEAEAARSRQRRMSQWQMDPRRRTYRLRLAVRQPACTLHPPALQAALARALLEAGLPVAMGLEKSPRPMVRLGHPLPLGVEGLAEWGDATLKEAPGGSLEAWIERINACCPQGLLVSSMEAISTHASPVLDLCQEARWAWNCPPGLLDLARARFAVFAAAGSYEIAKTGKVAGQKQVKHIEVRHLVLQLGWEGDRFHFTTRLSAGEALNPIKLLAGVMEVEPSVIRGLTRVSVELGEDPRLQMAEKFEPKLHNIFEDAVLLESGSNIKLIDDDDDEPLVIKNS